MPKILGNTQNAHISMAGGVKKVRLVRLYWRDFAGMSSQRGGVSWESWVRDFRA